MDAYTAAAIKVGPCSFSGSRVGNYGGQVILPLAHTIEHEEVINRYKLCIRCSNNFAIQHSLMSILFMLVFGSH